MTYDAGALDVVDELKPGGVMMLAMGVWIRTVPGVVPAGCCTVVVAGAVMELVPEYGTVSVVNTGAAVCVELELDEIGELDEMGRGVSMRIVPGVVPEGKIVTVRGAVRALVPVYSIVCVAKMGATLVEPGVGVGEEDGDDDTADEIDETKEEVVGVKGGGV